jgi:Zn finger protein HypA/HybF involved in hydrogenase expression
MVHTATIKHAHIMKGYSDDDYQYHEATVMGKCSNCCNRIEVEMDETNCPKCKAKFDKIPKEMLTAISLPVSV